MVMDPTVCRAASRGALGFALGGALVLVPVFGLFGLRLPAAGWTLFLAPMFAGGLIGGTLLGRGWKTAVGFGFAFVPPGFLFVISSVAPQAFGGGSFWEEEASFVLPLSIAFAWAGATGAGFSGLSARDLLHCIAGFAACGAIGGALYALWVMWLDAYFLLGTAIVVSFALSGAVAGTVFARATRAGIVPRHGLVIGGSLVALAAAAYACVFGF